MKIFAVIPVHNRREITLRMLTSVQEIACPDDVTITACVIDDGSTDGTAEAIRNAFSEVQIERTDGSLFWSGSVCRGIELFLASDSSHLWLLNDDMVLDESCLERLVDFVRSINPWVVSGTILDEAGQIIYGGIKRRPFFRFRKASEDDYDDGVCRAEAVNGNCLLVSHAALTSFTLPAPGLYRQEGMDMFIGLEATRLDHMPYVLRDAVGYAAPNETKMWFYGGNFSLRQRLLGILGPKGLPPRMYWDFCRRFAGLMAPVCFVRPFLRVFFSKRSSHI